MITKPKKAALAVEDYGLAIISVTRNNPPLKVLGNPKTDIWSWINNDRY